MLAAGVLALTTVAPTAVLAAEPDQQQEGTAAPDPVAVADPQSEPAFDPGGGSTDIPPATVPAPPAPASPDEITGAAEPEPTTDEAAPTGDLGDGSDAQRSSGQLPMPAPDATAPAPGLPAIVPAVTPPPSATAEAPPASAAPEIAPDEPATSPARPQPDDDAAAREREPGSARERPRPVQTLPLTTPGPPPLEPSVAPVGATAPAPPAQQPQPAQPTAAPAIAPALATAPAPIEATHTSESAAVRRSRAAQRGDRLHVVRPAESLWSIAGDLLGDDASTAQIAREVNRLWELNSGRIATGNPDLLAIGTKLVLR